jgi:hypothetical protein
MTIQSAIPKASGGSYIGLLVMVVEELHKQHEVVSGLKTPIDVCPHPVCTEYRHREAARMP